MNAPTNLKPLIDGDWLLYMACNAVEYSWPEHEDFEEGSSPPFEWVAQVFDNRVEEVCREIQTEAAPVFLFTGQDNFRKQVAKTKVYKGNRPSEKPYHYFNLKTYVEAKYTTAEDVRMEADDLMAIMQMDDTIIVSPDKDLRQVNGWHYSPELWNTPSWGPHKVTDENSYIVLYEEGKSKKIVGTGYKFFWSQMITGDTTDNIPGLPGKGPTFAYNLLADAKDRVECFDRVMWAYRDNILCADDMMEEQMALLWLLRTMKEVEEYDEGHN